VTTVLHWFTDEVQGPDLGPVSRLDPLESGAALLLEPLLASFVFVAIHDAHNTTGTHGM
jgi:hypothetical protein